MDVPQVRDALKAAGATVTAIRSAYDTIPEKVEAPAIVVSPAEPFITYHEANRGGLGELNFDVVILVALAQGWDRAQNVLDALLSSGTGETSSLIDALEAFDYTDVGVTHIHAADHAIVRSAAAYGLIDLPGAGSFATARLTVTVRTPRT